MDSLAFLSSLQVFVVLAVVGCLGLMLTSHHRQSLDFQIRLFLFAFVVRFGMSLVLYKFGLINVIKDEDGQAWVLGTLYYNAWQRAQLGVLDLPGALLEAFTVRQRGYYYLLGALFYVADVGRLPAAALNCWFGSLTIIYAYRIAEFLFTTKIAKRVGLWLCFFPSMILWSSQTIKEPVVIFLEVLGIYCCVRLRRAGFSITYLLISILCIILMIPFRFYAAYVTGAAIVISSIIPTADQGKVKVGPIIGTLLLLAFVVSSGVLATKSATTEGLDIDYIQNYRKNVAVGGSGMHVDVDLHTPGGMGIAVVVGALHLLLAPFPWQLGGGARVLMVFPEQLFWWYLFFWGVIPGLRATIRTRFFEVLPILVFLTGFGLLYSVLFGNVGLAYRQRAQLLPGLLIFASVGLESRRLGRVKHHHGEGPPEEGAYPPATAPRPDAPDTYDGRFWNELTHQDRTINQGAGSGWQGPNGTKNPENADVAEPAREIVPDFREQKSDSEECEPPTIDDPERTGDCRPTTI